MEGTMTIQPSMQRKFVVALTVFTLLTVPYASGFSPNPDWTSGIDAALDTTTAGKIYFFKGSHYSRFTDTTADSGYPLPMPGGWRGLPASWSSGIDAAVAFAPTQKIYLFKGNQYVRVTGTQVDPGYPLRLPGGWRGLPASWHSGIDAALYYEPTQKMYFFKGSQL
jgi:Hemopexin